MPRKCFLCGKNNTQVAHMHGLPSNISNRNIWLTWIAHHKECDVTDIPGRASLCSDHFLDSDYGKRKLKSGSVPKRAFLSNQSDQLNDDLEVIHPAQSGFDTLSTSTNSDRPLNIQNHETQGLSVSDSEATLCTNSATVISALAHTAENIALPNTAENQVSQSTEEYTAIIEINMKETLNEDETVEIHASASSRTFPHAHFTEHVFDVETEIQTSFKFPFQSISEHVSDLFFENHQDILNNSSQVLSIVENEEIFLQASMPLLINNINYESPNNTNLSMSEKPTSSTKADMVCERQHSPSNTRKKILKRECAALQCTHPSNDGYKTFPAITTNNNINYSNLERCRTWIQNCGNVALLSMDTNKLHSKFFLCSKHFEDDQFYNIQRKTLLPNAIPTIFDCAALTEVQMMQYPKLGLEDTILRSHQFFPELMTIEENNNAEVTLDALQLRFEEHMHQIKWITCPNCKEKFFKPANYNSTCLHSKNNCSMYTEENDMDPGEVPDVLKNLSYVETQLIALVHPLISVFKLSGHHQFGYKGNIINFPQDVKTFSKTLPHKIENLPSLITVRTSNELKPVDFIVRADRVHAALKWLKHHNPYYCDIEISEENLSNLPADDNVYDRVTKVINIDGVEPGEDTIDECYQEEVDDNADEHTNYVTETCIPTISTPSSSDKAEAILNWPRIDKEAINEFKTPGYIAMAFPTLFPYGKADLRNPRERNVSPNQYFKHLLHYHDERFAKHPRFRYFALNSVMRWNALRNGGVFVQKNSSFKDMTITELQESLKENPNLLKKILFYNSTLRGTKSYWYSRGQELLSMIEDLGLPTLFFTLSAADLHWPDLFHHIAPNENIDSMSESRRRKLIEENPYKVDAFFLERGETFIKEVLKKKFNVKDFWFRIEYQHRGSPHIHGVMWLTDAPKFDDLTKESPERRQEIANYFDKYINTTHPDIECPKGPIHPSRLRLSEVIDLKKDLAQLLNRVQRHTEHREGYCLRFNKKSKKIQCRFKFPVDTAPKTEIIITDEKDVELVTARNDSHLNKYNDYIIQTWRANMDISPVLSKRALVNYLAKYVTKAETKSKEMTDILQMLMSKSDSDKSVKSIIQQLYIQSCCERDISAQETCHLLMGLPLHSTGSRKFVSINFRVLDGDSWVPVQDEEMRNCKSYIEKYMERPNVFEDRSLHFMAKNYVLPSGKRYQVGKEAILQVYPKLTCSSKQTDSESYYRQKVLLFVPWRYEEQILEKFSSWEEAYKFHEEEINKSYQPQCSLENMQPDESEYEDIDPDEVFTSEEWMTISKMGPSQTVEKIELGRREIDINHDWHKASENYQHYGGVEKIKNFVAEERKKSVLDASQTPSMPSVEFTSDQKNVLKLLQLQIDSIKNNTSTQISVPKTVIVQGKAGTGKSLLIHAMKSMIHSSFGSNAFVLLGPTGVSALNINGSTIHSKLCIHPKTKQVLPLKDTAMQEFRKKFEKTLFVIVDEYSMVGCNMLHVIEQRLREAMDKETDQYGGVFIYFFGDIQQLAPVGDSPPYKSNQVSIEYINGKLLYHNIDAAVVLSEVKRQTDTDFLNVLSNISAGNVTAKDYNILQKRFTTSVSAEERSSFKDAVRLFPTRKEVDDFNKECIEKLKDPETNKPVPIARVPGIHNCNKAKDGTENEAGGLRSVLYLCKGAKIMLRANLWTEKGLVNGAVGTIVDILYKEGTSSPDDAPAAIVCKFESYKGPFLNDEEKTVVIGPILKQWKNKNGNDCTREQFPLSLCYACSIHKAQGLTLEKARINIGILKEMSPGLTYTALSRVKSLTGLLLEPFGLKRLTSLNKKQYIKDRTEWIQELQSKSLHLP